MKSLFYLQAGLTVALITLAILGARVWVLSSDLRTARYRTNQELAVYESSLNKVQADVTKFKGMAPGLGEFMTTIQLHMGKLWFATKAFNWELAQYELNEIEETMESARSLQKVENGVNVSGVLDSVIQTQVATLAQAINRKNQNEFLRAYDETLSACNGCHQETGREFIHIVPPSAPSVTNQRWEPTKP